MKSDRLDEIAARVLRGEAVREEPISAANRAAAINGMVRAMRRRRRQRFAAVGMGVFAAAAALVLALSFPRHLVAVGAVVSSGPATVATNGVHDVAAPRVVASGTPAGDGTPLAGTLSLPNGTRVVLDADTTCLLAAAFPATTLELTAGVLHADVAKLGKGERFIVRTPDAEVEVRGTSFDVARVASDPACGAGSTTRVVVREGVVAVRPVGQPEALVHAGETWPASCEGSAPPAATSAAPSIAAAPPHSDLAAQNDLFERALARKRAGDTGGAIATFDQLLARYPASHLGQSARAERMKLLVGVDHDRARAAAHDYLQRYPTGFARADAELILSSPN